MTVISHILEKLNLPPLKIPHKKGDMFLVRSAAEFTS